MDVDARLSQMEQLLAEARPVPLSSSVMVGRKEIEDLLSDVRAALPDELRQARWIIKEREDLLAQAQREAEQITADAHVERDRLVSETEVVRAARREAERILEEAREQSRVLRLEAEDYVDGKLANFEIVLNKTLSAVERGRERLRGRMASDELGDEGGEDLSAQLYDHEAGTEQGPEHV